MSTLFFTNAVLYANLVPRLPEVKERLDLSNAALGSGDRGHARRGAAGRAARAGVHPALRLGAGRGLGLVVLAVAAARRAAVRRLGRCSPLPLLVVGGMDAVVDVAQNAHGFRVQRGYGRSIVNAFHGLWSVGAVAGGHPRVGRCRARACR